MTRPPITSFASVYGRSVTTAPLPDRRRCQSSSSASLTPKRRIYLAIGSSRAQGSGRAPHALSSTAILPLILVAILLEKYIIRGMAAGAVK